MSDLNVESELRRRAADAEDKIERSVAVESRYHWHGRAKGYEDAADLVAAYTLALRNLVQTMRDYHKTPHGGFADMCIDISNWADRIDDLLVEAQGPARAATDGLREVSESILRQSNWRVDDNLQELRARLDVIHCEAAALSTGPSASGEAGLRPEVLAFAHLMEAQLRANDHKPGWKGDSPFALIRRMHEETAELFDAASEVTTAENVGREAADVANFAMMVADVCGALATPPAPATEPETRAVEAASEDPGVAWFDAAHARDRGGRYMREASVRWARTTPNPIPTHLVPYDDLSEPQKEAYRQIAEALWADPPPADAAVSDAAGEALPRWKVEYEITEAMSYARNYDVPVPPQTEANWNSVHKRAVDNIMAAAPHASATGASSGLTAEITRMLSVEQRTVNKSRQDNPVEMAKHAHAVGAVKVLKRLSDFAARRSPVDGDGGAS